MTFKSETSSNSSNFSEAFAANKYHKDENLLRLRLIFVRRVLMKDAELRLNQIKTIKKKIKIIIFIAKVQFMQS